VIVLLIEHLGPRLLRRRLLLLLRLLDLLSLLLLLLLLLALTFPPLLVQ